MTSSDSLPDTPCSWRQLAHPRDPGPLGPGPADGLQALPLWPPPCAGREGQFTAPPWPRCERGAHRHGTRGRANSKHWFTTSFLQPLPYLVTPQGPGELSAIEQFFVAAQTVISLLQTTQINQGVSFITANKVYTSANKTTIV